ncbi:putative invertase inhibitor [Cornus florida]|uniref:putative invertase inhibitor n=1 Tax=Cornus florida TaxID=4283 RepID=UPI0028966850|nr:putative invertase inhibitor [Cornus florida]
MPSLPALPLISLFLFFSLFVLLHLHPSSAATPPPSQLVDSVCKKTTNYTFCIQSLYSDSRTRTADRFVLAYVSFDLAYLNATHTKDYITNLLKNDTKRHASDKNMFESLRRCQGYYGKAVKGLAEAINDLDSETFSELGSLAKVADRASQDCEVAFKAKHYPRFLSGMNGDLSRLCKICIVVSKLF